MKYLGEAEIRMHNKTHTGYKVFTMRLNERELDIIAWLIDLHETRRTMLSEAGKEFQTAVRGLRKGIAQVKKEMNNESNC